MFRLTLRLCGPHASWALGTPNLVTTNSLSLSIWRDLTVVLISFSRQKQDGASQDNKRGTVAVNIYLIVPVLVLETTHLHKLTKVKILIPKFRQIRGGNQKCGFGLSIKSNLIKEYKAGRILRLQLTPIFSIFACWASNVCNGCMFDVVRVLSSECRVEYQGIHPRRQPSQPVVINFVSISTTIVFLPNLRLNWGDNDKNRIKL